MPFARGDIVKPKPGFAKPTEFAGGLMPAPPAGRIKAVSHYGAGQVIFLEGDTEWRLSGQYDLVKKASDAA